MTPETSAREALTALIAAWDTFNGKNIPESLWIAVRNARAVLATAPAEPHKQLVDNFEQLPTDKMIMAGHAVTLHGTESFNYIRAVWKAMVGALPRPAAPAELPKLKDEAAKIIAALSINAGSAEGRASSVGGNEANRSYAEEPTGSKVSASRVSSLDPASPPHAVAEPEKPMSLTDDERKEALRAWDLNFTPRRGQDYYDAIYAVFAAGKHASPSAQPIAEHTKRWNVEESDGGEIRICRGLHQSAEQCEWEYFVPKSAAQPIAREPTPDDSQLAGDVAYLRAKNDPRLFDIANQLIYCWSQDGLLSKAQGERDKLRDELAETKRPLDDQMRRLNERVVELNDENLALKRAALKSSGKEST